ncbi:MAG: DNA alkylation repair protein [Thermoanaerobaculia bacterium]|jgi:3-methyladenine DNA glycosylase AlkD|nr:DNA alkylation repair protein [Thermoanaerobaculia bacterium]MBP9825010.1 DNA alkylation repair protein [Thermoanaerobaculia bacterium]
MPPRRSPDRRPHREAAKPQRAAPAALPPDLPSALAALEARATPATLAGMARYALPSTGALGVAVGDIQRVAKLLGQHHALAAELWQSGIFEARMLAAYVDEPGKVTVAQMDRWARDFDNWGICDTVCFVLFDRTPHAWARVEAWSGRKEEYVRRAAFALLWGLTRHDRDAPDELFLHGLELIAAAATDERPYVQKAVNMALRATGKRNPALRRAAVAVALRLAAATDPGPRWVGKDALRELQPTARKPTPKRTDR